jgi:hypothetical protein
MVPALRGMRRPLAAGLAFALLAAGTAAAEDAAVPPSTWSLGLRATGYTYQTEDATGATENHTLFYEHYAGSAAGLAGGVLTVRAAGRFAETPPGAPLDPERSRLALGLVEAKLGPALRVQLGRQFLQSGVAGLTLDGARAVWRGRRIAEASVWGGAAAPADHAWEPGSLDESAAAGGRIVLRTPGTSRLGFSAAYRERYGVVAERPVGADWAGALGRDLRALARTTYDLEGDRWMRLEAQLRWRPRRGRTEVHVQALDRHPSVDAASWFSRFTDLERIRLVRAGLRWENEKRFGAEVEYVGSFTGARTANRAGLAVLLPGARIGYSLRVGDAGDESSFFGEAAWQARRWLRLEAEAAYLTYALFQDAPADQERDLTTLAARARVGLRPGLNLTAEVQSLSNPGYDQDVRVLVGLDAAMGRGASRFGLDRGGWLR